MTTMDEKTAKQSEVLDLGASSVESQSSGDDFLSNDVDKVDMQRMGKDQE